MKTTHEATIEVTINDAVDTIIRQEPRLAEYYSHRELDRAFGCLVTRLLVLGQMEHRFESDRE